MTSTDLPTGAPRCPATAPGPTPTPVRSRSRSRSRSAIALLVVLTLLVAGCGLRWEEPDPEPLVAGPVEQARQHATADAVALRVLTGQVAAQVTDPATLEVLALIEAATAEHLDVLGGLYDPGTDDETGPTGASDSDTAGDDPGDGTDGTDEEQPTGSADPGEGRDRAAPAAVPPAVTPPDLIALLEQSGAAARQDADDVPDGPLARLLASVAAARLLLADALTATLTTTPEGEPTAPVGATDPAAPSGGEDRTTDTTGVFLPPDAVPEGLTEHDAQALVQSEDALGAAWEVVAARGWNDARTRASDLAQRHRERAEQWARAAGISGTEGDPRRSAYDLPAGITATDADLAAGHAAVTVLEEDLATIYASLVASAGIGARAVLVDALVATSRTVVSLGGPVRVFPGLPERLPEEPQDPTTEQAVATPAA